jgi:hypothetical protein
LYLKEEITRDFRKLHNEEFQNLYFSPNIVIINSRKMGCAGHVLCVGEEGNS